MKKKNVTTQCRKRKPSLKYVNISQICFMKKVSQTVVNFLSLRFFEKKFFFTKYILSMSTSIFYTDYR